MALIDLKMREYLDVLKSCEPAPGGGSASALAGAQGMALIIMVCDLTLGKEKYSAYHDVCRDARERAQLMLNTIVKLIDEDTEAYNALFNAFKMPKDTDAQKAERTAAINSGTEVSIEVPLSVMKLAYGGLELISGLAGKTNPNAASDLGVAALNLHAAVNGARLNVMINLPGISDEELSKRYLKESENIYHNTDKIINKVYHLIVNGIS